MFFIGYPEDIPEPRARKSLRDIVLFNDGKSRRDEMTIEPINPNPNPEGMA